MTQILCNIEKNKPTRTATKKKNRPKPRDLGIKGIYTYIHAYIQMNQSSAVRLQRSEELRNEEGKRTRHEYKRAAFEKEKKKKKKEKEKKRKEEKEERKGESDR